MQIHELNTFAGTPGADNFLAIDNGSDTGKISGEALLKGPNDRIDNLITNVLPDSVVTLYSNDNGISGTVTLSDDVSNYDFLDLYFKDFQTGNHRGGVRVPVSQFPADISIPTQDSNFNGHIYISRCRVTVSGNTLTTAGRLWEWNGESNSDAFTTSGAWLVMLVRVDGIKISSNTSAELTDIRVGYDGTVYPSAGDAVREQIINVRSALTYKLSEISEGTRNILRLLAKGSTTTKGLTYSCDHLNGVKISGTTNATNADCIFPLQTPITLDPGADYVFSISGQFVSNATVYFYLLNNGTAIYNNAITASETFKVINLQNGGTFDSLLIRVAIAGATLSLDISVQLEKGKAPTQFIPSATAADFSLREKVEDLIEKPIRPIFQNGTINAGIPDYSNNSSCITWLVTDKIIHVLKGSRINYVGNKPMRMIIAKFNSDGTFAEYILNQDMISSFVFTSDTYIRIACRFTNYDNIVPSDVYENYQFILYSDEETEKEIEIIYIGLGTGTTLSGQAQLIKFPNGKNMLIDSHLLPYYNGFHNLLRNNGVRRIDYYVQSHYHQDHCGILNILKENPSWIDITDAVVYLPQLITLESIAQVSDDPSILVQRQNDMIAKFEANNCTIIRPTDGQIANFDDGISLEFYNTDHSVYSDASGAYYSTNYNDWSLCCNLRYGLNLVNFSSDIGPIAQSKVGGTLPKATILTAPHHGWDNGVNNLVPAFINNINPDLVVSVNGWEHNPANTDSPANIMLATSAMQSFCEANAVSNYPTFLNGPIKMLMNIYGWKFNGNYSRYIRNGKNWKFNDNSDKIEP